MKKRIISIVLALVVLFASTAFAYTDVPSYDAGFEAISMVTNLGLMEGFDDGSFRPDDTLTRAETAKIFCCILDIDPVPGISPFNDIPEDTEGWINAAYANGIINGRGDGSFYPDDPAAYEEAIKMIVCALGDEPEAMKRGGWYIGYVALAVEYKITNGVGGKVGDSVTRRQFAMLLNNALEVPIFGSSYQEGCIVYTVLKGENLMSIMTERMNRDAEDNKK